MAAFNVLSPIFMRSIANVSDTENMIRYLPLTALTLAACQTVPDTPELHLPDRLTWRDAPTLSASGLEPGQPYRLTVERPSAWNATAIERAELSYTTDDRGRLSTRADPYAVVAAMDYIANAGVELPDNSWSVTITTANATPVLSGELPIGPDRTRLVESALGDAFPGAFVMTSRDFPGPRPALVILGGSEGGITSARNSAPVFAAEGYTVLGFPYYSPAWFGQDAAIPELPRGFSELPIDAIEAAIAALRQRPDVDPDRILLMGGSKGAEYVLLAGALIPDDSDGGGFCAIVADVPSDVVWEGWGPRASTAPQDGPFSGFSWRGNALPFVPYKDMSRALNRSDSYTMTQAHENGRAANPGRVPTARIPVEAIDEPVLVIGGDQDTTWPSGPMARSITQRRLMVGLDTESYIYPDAGHAVGGHPLSRAKPPDNAARQENFPAMMSFLRRAAGRENCRD